MKKFHSCLLILCLVLTMSFGNFGTIFAGDDEPERVPVTFTNVSVSFDGLDFIFSKVECYRIRFTIKSNGSSTLSNLYVSASCDGAGAVESVDISSLDPGETATKDLILKLPIKSVDTAYTVKLNAYQRNSALWGTEDVTKTITVKGNKYRIYWGYDNLPFGNTPDVFGSTYGSYSSPIGLFNASNTEAYRIGSSFGAGGSYNNFCNGNTKAWNGSCYGMALVMGNYIGDGHVDMVDLGLGPGEHTYAEACLHNAKTTSKTKWWINVSHMSQKTDCAINNRHEAPVGTPACNALLRTMWSKACDIGSDSSNQTPYLVVLGKAGAGHAVLCYGAESGAFSYKARSYTKRLLIADPNKQKETYIYISNDYNYAIYNGNTSYNIFGLWNTSVENLTKWCHESNGLLATSSGSDSGITAISTPMASFMVSDGTNSATVEDGVITTGDLEATVQYFSDDDEDDVDDAYATDFIVVLPDGSKDYTITPLENADLDAVFYNGDTAVDVKADADAVELSADGETTLKNADGEIKTELIYNTGDLSFVEIDGTADGDVEINGGKSGDAVIIDDSLTDCVIKDLDDYGETFSSIALPDNLSVKVEKNEESELAGKYDANHDGTYDTDINEYDGGDDSGDGPIVDEHIWDNDYTVDVEPTCTKAGEKSIHCQHCSATKDKVTIPALGHKMESVVLIPAGNCKNGQSCDKCKVCGYKTNYKTINGWSTSYVKSFKVSKGKKCFTAKWKKQSKKNQKAFSGYQIRYSKSSSMAGCKYVTAKKSAKSKKISKLSKKTKYYVQMRSYKTVGGVKYYSSWSAKKAVKTK